MKFSGKRAGARLPAACKVLLIGVALGAAIPVYGSAVVQGVVFEYPNYLSPPNLPPFGVLYNSPVNIAPPTDDTVSWNFTCSTCSGYSISAYGDARVVNGALGADSSVTVTGSPSGPHYLAEANSYTQYTDSLTITGGTGTGVLALQYDIDTGVISSTGSGFNDSFAYMALFQAPTGTESQLNNFALSSTTEVDFDFSGNFSGDTVTYYIPFTYGTAFSMEPIIRTTANFYLDFDSTPFTATTDFLDTATPISALVYGGTPGSLGSLNTGAIIGSTSGLNYGPNGVTAPAPEPSTWLTVAAAFGALAFAVRRNRATA